MNPLVLVEQCYNKLPQGMKARPWEATDHGRKVLQSEDELNAYIAAYGEMHIIKCHAALQNFPFEDLKSYSYEIFDWGCGQGLATLTLLDMLQERGMLSRLECIHLIEPSHHALDRATRWVKQYAGPGVDVIPIEKYIPDSDSETMPEITCSSRISINLFSNILDLKSLSLSWIAKKTAELASSNYMICIGPKFTQNTNTRIADFCGYFMPEKYFSDINAYPYAYTSRTHHAFGCEARSFVHKKSSTLNSDYKECAESVEYVDTYEDYATAVLKGVVDDNILKFYKDLHQSCSSLFDIYFRPCINCDTVDFLLINQNRGIVLINTCQNLENIETEKKRIDTIKSDLFNVYLKTIKTDSVASPCVYNCVKTALYFPNNTTEEINEKIKEININRNEKESSKKGLSKNKDYFAYLYRFTASSNLKEEISKINAFGFKFDYYTELTNLIFSGWHSFKDGDTNFRLSQRQKEIVKSDNKRLRIKGVAGCGKTLAVANKAVEQHLKTGDRVLIITFNISLIQYIRMRINQVPADFSPNMFEVINYHQFIKSAANQYAQDRDFHLEDFDNPAYFAPYRKKIKKYKSIIVDEIQDFKESWIQSLVMNFLSKDGTICLFGDGEQNIYDRELEKETKMPPISNCGFLGRWNEMNERISMRILNPKIASLCSKFAHNFLGNDADIAIQEDITFEDYHIKYWNIDTKTTADTLAGNIRWIMSEYKIDPKDLAVLGQSINILRELEVFYSNATGQKTMINFEAQSQFEQVRKNPSPTFIQKDLDEIRRAAKTHFTTDCPNVKLSTIHSFKGWESKSVILIIQPNMQPEEESFDGYKVQERENTPALIYTAMTRAKCNLFILNLGNGAYHEFFQKNIEQ